MFRHLVIHHFLPDVYEMSEFSLTFQHVSCIFVFSFVILFLHASSFSTYFITISRPLISMFVVSFICHYLSMLILLCVFDPSKPQLSSMTESPNVEPPSFVLLFDPYSFTRLRSPEQKRMHLVGSGISHPWQHLRSVRPFVDSPCTLPRSLRSLDLPEPSCHAEAEATCSLLANQSVRAGISRTQG